MVSSTSGARSVNHCSTQATSASLMEAVVRTWTASKATSGNKKASGTMAGELPRETRSVVRDNFIGGN